ncbi:hypothetical protein BC497_29410 (plasmid) [Klebsiella variicola]|nr:hypothetical protein BC497_29410 [Klebsiella variicola]
MPVKIHRDKEIGLMMDYAKEKYGGILKLTGSDDFKSRCANVAAENGLNVILKRVSIMNRC